MVKKAVALHLRKENNFYITISKYKEDKNKKETDDGKDKEEIVIVKDKEETSEVEGKEDTDKVKDGEEFDDISKKGTDDGKDKEEIVMVKDKEETSEVEGKEDTDKVKDGEEFDDVSKAICKFIEEMNEQKISHNMVKLYEAPVYQEKHMMDWYKWRNILQDNLPGNGENPHIIFLADAKRNPPTAMRIQHTIRTLKRECIVITDAVGTRGPGGPTAFPSDSVIAVSDKTHKAYGSTVDFVMESEDSWGSAMRAVAVTAAVLVKAQHFGKYFYNIFCFMCHSI